MNLVLLNILLYMHTKEEMCYKSTLIPVFENKSETGCLVMGHWLQKAKITALRKVRCQWVCFQCDSQWAYVYLGTMVIVNRLEYYNN